MWGLSEAFFVRGFFVKDLLRRRRSKEGTEESFEPAGKI